MIQVSTQINLADVNRRTVKAAVFCTILDQFAVGLHRGTENKHARVKAVGPARIRSS